MFHIHLPHEQHQIGDLVENRGPRDVCNYQRETLDCSGAEVVAIDCCHDVGVSAKILFKIFKQCHSPLHTYLLM